MYYTKLQSRRHLKRLAPTACDSRNEAALLYSLQYVHGIEEDPGGYWNTTGGASLDERVEMMYNRVDRSHRLTCVLKNEHISHSGSRKQT